MSVVTNRVLNPSAESNTTGYTAVPGTTGAIAAGCVSTTATTAFGTKVSRTTWTTASTAAGGGQYYEVTLAAAGLAVGDFVSAGIFHVLSHIVTRLQFSVEFRTDVATISTSSAATQLVTAIDTVYGTAAAPDAAMLLENIQIPATCTRIRIRVLSVAGTSYANWSIGSYLDLDGVQLEKSATLHPYVDGSLGHAYGWLGTAGASLSVKNTPEIVLEPITTMDPQPRVKITVTDLYPDTNTITLYRVADATGTVREAIRLFAQGGFSVEDAEAPFMTTVSYRAMQYTEAGASTDYTPEASTYLDFDGDLISDPLRPASVVQVEFTVNAGLRPERPIPGAVKRVYTSSGIRLVALVGEEGGLTDLNMDFYTSTFADYEAMRNLIKTANGLVVIRTPPIGAMRMIPRVLYAFASNAVPDDFNLSADLEEIEWSNSVDETSQPEVGYATPLATWQTYIDAFPTWLDMENAYLTWLDAIKSPPGT